MSSWGLWMIVNDCLIYALKALQDLRECQSGLWLSVCGLVLCLTFKFVWKFTRGWNIESTVLRDSEEFQSTRPLMKYQQSMSTRCWFFPTTLSDKKFRQGNLSLPPWWCVIEFEATFEWEWGTKRFSSSRFLQTFYHFVWTLPRFVSILRRWWTSATMMAFVKISLLCLWTKRQRLGGLLQRAKKLIQTQRIFG